MTDEEIRETRLKVLEKDLASINNRLHHAFNQGFELGRKSTVTKEKTRWVPVSERLPEKGKQVLCCNRQGSVFTSAITFEVGNMVAFGQHTNIIAWMPLPEPYRAESEERNETD